MPALSVGSRVGATRGWADRVRAARLQGLRDGRDDFRPDPHLADRLVPRDVAADESEERGQRPQSPTTTRALALRNDLTVLHKLRRAMVRPGRDRLRGLAEVDETYVNGPSRPSGGPASQGSWGW